MVDVYRGFQTKVLVTDEEKDEVELELKIFENCDVCEFHLEGLKIFSGDWSANFEKLFTKALEECQTLRRNEQ